MEPKRTLGQEMRVVPETREDTRPVSEKGKKDIYS